MRQTIAKKMVFYSVAAFSVCTFCVEANAQLNDSPWGFSSQNRASIAALIQQVENADDNTSASAATSVTTLVCGGDSADSSAAGNSTCIILNNSDGLITLNQENMGNQDANSESSETTNVEETINVDEILATLDGGTETASAETLSDLLE